MTMQGNRKARSSSLRRIRQTRARAGAATVGVMLLLICGCQVKAPGKLESSIATQVKHKLTVGNRAMRNPLPATEENIRMGQKSFTNYCMVCHGLDGQATGVPFAQAMYPPVPSLNSAEVQGYTDGQLKWIIENGIGPSGMPAAKGILNDDEIWTIVDYLRHLPAKGSLGEPAVYNGGGK